MHRAPCYVIDGISEVEIAVPAGHAVVGFRYGIRPKSLPLPDKARCVMVGPVDDNDMRGLPIVLLVMPHAHVAIWQRTPQALIDGFFADVVAMQARETCMGSA
jgi:hypothetical protein